ncbi:MAG: PAS domain S-box protein [Ignavibacteriaceae bacterium]
MDKIDENINSTILSKNNHQSDLPQNNHVDKENNWGLDNYLFSALMNNLPDIIYFKDLESRFIKINNGYLKKIGASSEAEILGKTDFEIFDYEHADSARKDELHIIKTGKPIINKVEKEVLPSGKIDHNQITTKK